MGIFTKTSQCFWNALVNPFSLAAKNDDRRLYIFHFVVGLSASLIQAVNPITLLLQLL